MGQRKPLPPQIEKVLRDNGEELNDTNIWLCHDTWVVKHACLERLAAKLGVEWLQLDIVYINLAERMVGVVAKGSLKVEGGARLTEFATGEAMPINTDRPKKSGGTLEQPYPMAMAEKRAKDRVILKLVGLAGFAYSEEESEDFRRDGATSPPETSATETVIERTDDLPQSVPGPKWLDEVIPAGEFEGKTWGYLVHGDESNAFKGATSNGRRYKYILFWANKTEDKGPTLVPRCKIFKRYLEEGSWPPS